MLRLRAGDRPAPADHVDEVRHHDLPAGRSVAHGHVRPQAGRSDGVPRRVQADRRPTCPACRSASTSRCRPRCGTSWPCIRSLVSVDEHSDSLVMTGYSENANRTRHHPSFGSVVSQAARRRRQRHPAVRQPARHVAGHRAGLPRRRPSAVHAERPRPAEPAPGQRRRRATGWTTARRCCTASTTSAATSTPRGTMNGLDAFTSRAFDMVASGTVRKALDLTSEEPRSRDRYKGVEQFLTARRLVEAGVGCVTLSYRRLGHARQQLQDAAQAAAAGRSRRRQPDPGPARPRHGQRRGHGHVGRVRPDAADQRATTAAATTGRRSCRPWSPAAA